jgi:hypothetical protein
MKSISQSATLEPPEAGRVVRVFGHSPVFPTNQMGILQRRISLKSKLFLVALFVCSTSMSYAQTTGQRVFQTFQASFNGQSFVSTTAFTVPLGKRLVIEHISAVANVTPTPRLISFSLRLIDSNNTFLGEHFLPIPAGVSFDPVGSARVIYSLSQPFRMFVDAGQRVFFNAHLTGSSLTTNDRIACTMSGFLVNA